MTKARDLADLGNKTSLDEINDAYDAGALSNRNIIINGEFDIDQRGLASSTAFQAGAHFVADRWSYYINSEALATFSATHEISDEAPSGFTKSLKVTCTSGGSIPATGEVVYRQKIEGYNIKRLGYGTPSAKSLTLSFWIKASVTGDYGVQLIYEADDSANRYYVSKYTVNSANTWEYKTITIPPNTAGALKYTTTGIGALIYWDWGEGSTYSGTADSGWTNTYYNGLSGGVKLMENTGATWQQTGVQLEVGDTATPFEHRSYGDELAKCQRYFCKSFPIGTTPANDTTADVEGRSSATAYSSVTARSTKQMYPVRMRATPTVTLYNGQSGYSHGKWQYYNGSSWQNSTTTFAKILDTYFYVSMNGSYTFAYSYLERGNWTADAEL